MVKVNYSKSIAEYEKDLKARDESIKLLGTIVSKMETHNTRLNEELDAAQVLLEEVVGDAAPQGESNRDESSLLESVRGIKRQQSLFKQNTEFKEKLLEAREAVRISEVADKVREEEAQDEAIERAQSEAVSQLEDEAIGQAQSEAVSQLEGNDDESSVA